MHEHSHRLGSIDTASESAFIGLHPAHLIIYPGADLPANSTTGLSLWSCLNRAIFAWFHGLLVAAMSFGYRYVTSILPFEM